MVSRELKGYKEKEKEELELNQVRLIVGEGGVESTFKSFYRRRKKYSTP